MAGPDLQRGVFISRVRRMGQSIPSLSGTVLQQGDIVTLYGPEEALARAAGELGNLLPPGDKTDFIFLGLGVVLGLLIGHAYLTIGAVELTLGSGGGTPISGLFFGWRNMRHPVMETCHQQPRNSPRTSGSPCSSRQLDWALARMPSTSSCNMA
ncbi:TrkA C-terminal domain-containing protein [Aminobacter sp. AP02]|uniref:TrkA C-terminal domain-containing protein n=1 Tax=Aminobacter sp. AP02 TaxID=2135737 RepID=UPI001FE09281|nr:TrkA C-terminal domain-containing protein [Aminobacter sp. AP02]